ncbi:hypothetical protein T06_12774 [Trichinella sp. T6]|nr:hypothetical protein T06_12774 [Trichinella sp. T6]
MSHAESDNDSLLDLLNDSLEKNDIGSAGDSDYIEKSDHDTSSEFSGTFLSESQTEEVMNERSDPQIERDHVCSLSKQEPSRNVLRRAYKIYSGRPGPTSVESNICNLNYVRSSVCQNKCAVKK